MSHRTDSRSSKLPHSSAGVLWSILLMMCLVAFIKPSIVTDAYRGVTSFVAPRIEEIQNPSYAPAYLRDRFGALPTGRDELSSALILNLLTIVGALCLAGWGLRVVFKWMLSGK